MGGAGSGRKPRELRIPLPLERHRLDNIDRIDVVRPEFKELATNPVFESLKLQWEQEKSGIGFDVGSYIEWTNQAADAVMKDPSIIDNYKIDLDTGHDPMKNVPMSPVEHILHFRANPWLVAELVFGERNLNKATALATKFTRFTPFQKGFLRDALDPRILKMLFIACRSAAKTWLTALASDIMSYVTPRIRIMVVSGSQEQSDNLYRYFKDLAEGTAYERLVHEAMYKTKTSTLAGGWIQAFPASHKKVHGPRPDVVIVDEACKAESDIILAAQSAAMSARIPKFIVTTTPDAMHHIVHTWYNTAQEQLRMTPVELAGVNKFERWNYYHLTAYECPWITEDAINTMIALYGGKHTHEYKIYVLGEFAPAEGLVFSEETIRHSIIDELPTTVKIDVEDGDKNVFTVEQPIAIGNYWTGLDVGGRTPSACVTSCTDQVGNVYIIDDVEIPPRAGEDPIISEHMRQVRKYFSRSNLDAAPIQWFLNRKIQRSLKTEGLPGCHFVPFGKDKPNMISAFRGLLEAGMLFIHSRCSRLINQLYTYAYDENRQDDMPQKGNDDHVDAGLLCVYPHKNNYLTRRFKVKTMELYNLDDHLEPVNPSPFLIPEINPFAPR